VCVQEPCVYLLSAASVMIRNTSAARLLRRWPTNLWKFRISASDEHFLYRKLLFFFFFDGMNLKYLRPQMRWKISVFCIEHELMVAFTFFFFICCQQPCLQHKCNKWKCKCFLIILQIGFNYLKNKKITLLRFLHLIDNIYCVLW
jgi:hypothetical protein